MHLSLQQLIDIIMHGYHKEVRQDQGLITVRELTGRVFGPV